MSSGLPESDHNPSRSGRRNFRKGMHDTNLDLKVQIESTSSSYQPLLRDPQGTNIHTTPSVGAPQLDQHHSHLHKNGLSETHKSHAHHHASGLEASHASVGRRRLRWTLIITASYMVAEIVFGLMAHSLALIADAFHMLSDVAALLLSLFALTMSLRKATAERTFGYHRSEILAALANGALLIAMSVLVFIEAIKRLQAPQAVQGSLVMGVAFLGLVLNLVGMALLHGSRTHNLNLRGAWLHLLSDAVGSISAVISGVLVLSFGWNWADPVASICISLLIIFSAWQLLTQAVSVLMEGVPDHIKLDEVQQAMRQTTGVIEVHDLHVWSITTGHDSLSGHVVASSEVSHAEVLVNLREMLQNRFGIDHITLQIEPSGFQEHRNALCFSSDHRTP